MPARRRPCTTTTIPSLRWSELCHYQTGVFGSQLKYLTLPVGAVCLSVCLSAVDFELNLCDVQPGVLGGVQEEFLYVGRLDNLGSCYTALEVISTRLALFTRSHARVLLVASDGLEWLLFVPCTMRLVTKGHLRPHAWMLSLLTVCLGADRHGKAREAILCLTL